MSAPSRIQSCFQRAFVCFARSKASSDPFCSLPYPDERRRGMGPRVACVCVCGRHSSTSSINDTKSVFGMLQSVTASPPFIGSFGVFTQTGWKGEVGKRALEVGWRPFSNPVSHWDQLHWGLPRGEYRERSPLVTSPLTPSDTVGWHELRRHEAIDSALCCRCSLTYWGGLALEGRRRGSGGMIWRDWTGLGLEELRMWVDG